MPTPLVRKLSQNGTLITFESSIDDYNYYRNSANKGFRFSYFTLLDIPPIQTPVNGKNDIQFNSIEGSFINGLSSNTPPPEGDRTDLAESLQNYLLNLETLIIRSSDYNPSLDLNPSERLFFKWLKEIGAIRYKNADISKLSSNTLVRFEEESDNNVVLNGNLYSKLVKHIGTIDAEGNNRSNQNSYQEVYIYIPSEAGFTPNVIFKTVSDENYHEAMVIKKSGTTNLEYIDGRDSSSDPTSAGLTTKAFYDMDVSSGITYTLNSNPNQTWFDFNRSSGPDIYTTDFVFNDVSNDVITKIQGANSVSNIRNRLDGVMVDFDKSTYNYFKQNPTHNFSDFNNSGASGSFNFNAIAIYYDIFDKTDSAKSTQNLYGIIFIDDLSTLSTSGAIIPQFNKIKPDVSLRRQGNSYGIKLNLKLSNDNLDSVTESIEISTNPNAGFSMDVFLKGMQVISKASKNLEDSIAVINNMQTKMDELESLIINSSSAVELSAKIDEIKSALDESVINSDLLAIINQQKARIDEILSGKTSVSLSLLFDIKGVGGIKAYKSDNKIFIENTREEYNSIVKTSLLANGRELNTSNILTLNKNSNLVYHKNIDGSVVATGNMILYIDDSSAIWNKNQSFKISLLGDIDFGPYSIVIYTDSPNRTSDIKPYSKLVGIINNIGNRKLFEIICIDNKNLDFIII